LDLRIFITATAQSKPTVSSTLAASRNSHVLTLSSLVTWFRIIVKQISLPDFSYTWHEISFVTKWTVDASIAICFDVPEHVRTRIEEAVTHPSRSEPTDIYAFHVVILDQFISLLDNSVWALRDALRQIETVSSHP